MSDFTQALKYRKLSSARVMTREEALKYNVRSGSTNPDKYYKIQEVSSLDVIFGYFTLKANTDPEQYSKVPGDVVFQYEMSLPENFFIKSLFVPGDPTLIETMVSSALYVRFRVGNTSYRYFLAGVQKLPAPILPRQLNFTRYDREVIGKNCVFEVVRTYPLLDAFVASDIQVITGMYRLPDSADEKSYSLGTASIKPFSELKIETNQALPFDLNCRYLDNDLS